MALEKIADRIVETDVLVVGGGIAGCPAAAKAAEHGLKVTLAEKAKTDRSGSAAEGIDHYGGAFPRGMTPKEWQGYIDSFSPGFAYGAAPWADPTRFYRQYANGMWAVEELEKLGVTMRWTDGERRPCDCHHEGPFLRVHWQNVKPEMAAGVRKRGVNVLERTMVVDLLTNNGVVTGATAIDTRTGEFIVIKSKAVVIATAACSRVINPETPLPWKYKFNYHWCPSSVSGDGWAMAYRAGAELSSMEQAERGGRFRDDKVMSFGNHGNEGIPAKRLTWDGEETIGRPGFRSRRFAEIQRQGRDEPRYISLEHLPDDYQKRVEVAFVDERLVSFKIAEDRGFNPRTHWYETMDNRVNQLHVEPGIYLDADFMSSLPGLYAVGDCMAGNHDVANAAASGFLVGDSIHEFVNKASEPVIDEARVESLKQISLAPLGVKDGTEPMELESAVRYICDRYVGVARAEGRLREGLRRLGSLKREFLPQLVAKNPHYLMRALEVRNVMDIAELHIQACLERKETRMAHTRLDYPEADPSLDDMLLFQRLENGKSVIEFRKRAPMALPDDHKEER